jgi:hypothetical protein
MVDSTLLETLERLTPGEQKTMLAVAEFLKSRRSAETDSQGSAEALFAELRAELLTGEPRFNTSDEGLSPARLAARRFMRENPTLMRLLAQ